VPTSDDERFERYLKQFHPLVPDALPIKRRERALSRHWVGIRNAGAVAVIIFGVISFRIIHNRVSGRPASPQSLGVSAPMQLTMRDANSLLAGAQSYKAALDGMAFHRQGSTVPKDKQSAVAVLAKEKIKL
jgi:hypothetical protein